MSHSESSSPITKYECHSRHTGRRDGKSVLEETLIRKISAAIHIILKAIDVLKSLDGKTNLFPLQHNGDLYSQLLARLGSSKDVTQYYAIVIIRFVSIV